MEYIIPAVLQYMPHELVGNYFTETNTQGDIVSYNGTLYISTVDSNV